MLTVTVPSALGTVVAKNETLPLWVAIALSIALGNLNGGLTTSEDALAGIITRANCSMIPLGKQ